MATYAIGDIHGRLGALRKLLIELDPDKDRLVFLGDYTDRGPHSSGVLELLVQVAAECPKAVFLRGNHDWMMMHAKADAVQRKHWLEKCGGDATLRSYGGKLSMVPFAHWYFLENTCRDLFETNSHIFVHGGIEPDLPVVQQTIRTLHWRRIYDAAPHMSKKVVVCGHTQQGSGLPLNLGHTLCVDTRDWLTAANLSDGTFVQAKDDGSFRSFHRLPPVAPVPARKVPVPGAAPVPIPGAPEGAELDEE